MSLLADLLSKIKPYTAKGDVPPGLKNVVSDSTKKETARKKIVIFSVLVILAVVAGVGAVYIMDIYLKPSQIKRAERRPQPAAVESPKAEVKIQEQPPITDAVTPKIPSEAETKAASRKAADKREPEVLKDKAQPAVKPKERGQAAAGKRKKEPADKTVKQAEMQRENISDDSQPKRDVKSQQPKKAESQEAAQKEKQAPDSSSRDVYLYTARTYESRRDYQQAFLNYKKALEIDPENYVIMNNISSVLIQLSSFEEAVGYAGKVLSIKKDYVPSLVNLGIAYIRLGNLTEGEGYLSKALSREPSNNYALLNLGILHERRGDNDKAYGYFLKLSDMRDVQGYLGVGRIFEKQGRKADASRIYKDILSINNIDSKTKKFVNDRLIQLGQ